MESLRHDLFEELDAFDPKWQERYDTLWAAARAARVLDLYSDFIRTEHGQAYLRRVASAHDHQADNRARKAQLQAELNMANRGWAAAQRGYITEGDEV